ncbi:protein N-terminal asparagine amidohydrolase [Exophiala viscosa]|uniref:Protein N-terminal asparagine amidohydrolase n=1 Tax=Exophiala viscosa TaxID=2486360 RepID=A0AAN6DVD3_9EURO|nr:protein N-terminal asparagine amidohydrolase [Exophiala viscosa]
MKVATIQFSPRLGEVAANFSRAESLLMREEREGLLDGIDLLVLPELAFTGYNHPSLAAIAPFLEPTAAGPSTKWASRTAKRLKCTVAVGYPEAAEGGNYNTIFDKEITAEVGAIAYNSLVFVSSTGDVVAHYRKSFLYYTDETWAQEGSGFWAGVLPIGGKGQQVKAAGCICMDLNPYRFEAPWTAYEFGNHARESRAKVVVVSMAWLTRLNAEEVSSQMMVPDHDTINYWVDRLSPLFGTQGADPEAIVIFANRAGEEGVSPRIGEVRYAGSSSVMGMTKGQQVRIWDIFGRGQEGVLLVDTESPPKYTIKLSTASSESSDATEEATHQSVT